ncbi:MAG: nucleotide exchange factor GrpE [Acidobacteria bacterium]|nr:nucleotide exchange factor GrpE [Acidobacteriota bacterium]
MIEYWLVKLTSWWAERPDWRDRPLPVVAACVCVLLMFACSALAVALASYWPSPGNIWPLLFLGSAAVAALAIVTLLGFAPFTIEPPKPPNPLDDRAWLKLAEECVELFDEVDRHLIDFDPKRRELAEHVLFRLRELLERSGVEVIAKEEPFDRYRHQAIAPPGSRPQQMTIAEVLSPGFAVRQRVLRRARVRLTQA